MRKRFARERMAATRNSDRGTKRTFLLLIPLPRACIVHVLHIRLAQRVHLLNKRLVRGAIQSVFNLKGLLERTKTRNERSGIHRPTLEQRRIEHLQFVDLLHTGVLPQELFVLSIDEIRTGGALSPSFSVLGPRRVSCQRLFPRGHPTQLDSVGAANEQGGYRQYLPLQRHSPDVRVGPSRACFIL